MILLRCTVQRPDLWLRTGWPGIEGEDGGGVLEEQRFRSWDWIGLEDAMLMVVCLLNGPRIGMLLRWVVAVVVAH